MKNLSSSSIKLLSAVLAGVLGLTNNISVAQEAGMQAGMLVCTVVEGSRLNLLIRSTADVECEYDNQGNLERYRGETGIGLGLDLSFKTEDIMYFAVVAASNDVTPGAYALAGRYVGGELNAAAGVGLGAKGLVSVGNSSFGLQPIAINTSKGLGVSGGLSFLYIEPDK